VERFDRDCEPGTAPSQRSIACFISGGSVGSSAAPAPPSQMTEKEQLLSLAFGGNTFETMSSLVQEEIRQYLPVMNTASSEMDLPLPFWTHAERFPSFFRIARRVLPTPVSSTDVERMFSVCGLICTSNRASLSPNHVTVLTSLSLWLKEKYGYHNKRADKSADSYKRYVTISADLELVIPTDPEDPEDDGEYDPLFLIASFLIHTSYSYSSYLAIWGRYYL
jgi:hypothetical protein